MVVVHGVDAGDVDDVDVIQCAECVHGFDRSRDREFRGKVLGTSEGPATHGHDCGVRDLGKIADEVGGDPTGSGDSPAHGHGSI